MRIIDFPLREEFETYLLNNKYPKGTIDSYLSNINTISKNINNFEEKFFLFIIPIALCAGDSVDTLINSLKFKIKNKDKKSAFNLYEKFIKGIKNQFFENNYKKLHKDYDIFSQNDIKAKMHSRIMNQSRLSGDKTWFPLTFIQKLCNAKNKDIHIKYRDKLYKKLHIIINESNMYVHKELSSFDFFSLIPISSNLYCCCVYKKGGQVFQVFTPDILNKKKELIVSGIKEIAIDHVTPIDTTLKQLKLKAIDKISREVKDCKQSNVNLKGKDLEKKAFDNYKAKTHKLYKNFWTDLENELNKILDDSHYRLISSKENAQKGNFVDYKEFFKDINNNDYYAKIYEPVSFNNKDMVLVHKLDEPTPQIMDRISFDQKILNGTLSKCKQVEVPIDLL